VATDINHHQMFVNGKHVDSDESDQIRDPATEEVYSTIARGTAEHAHGAVVAARAAFESGPWPRLTPDDRSKVMTEIADRIAAVVPGATPASSRWQLRTRRANADDGAAGLMGRRGCHPRRTSGLRPAQVDQRCPRQRIIRRQPDHVHRQVGPEALGMLVV
jgi:acyl-CoA reductase-like NAD-dependent aldehyde dehydrogenase